MKKGFTLIEILITLAILLILVTILMVSYNSFIEKARAKVCETNLQTLLTAVKMYVIRYDRFPASLGSLEPEDLNRAYAKVMEDRDWFTKLSYYFVKLNTPKEAYAQFDNLSDLMDPAPDKMGRYVDPEIFVCPSDDSPEGISYGISADLLGKSWQEVLEDDVIVGDSDDRIFTEATLCHRHNIPLINIPGAGEPEAGVALTIKKSGNIEELSKEEMQM